LTTPKAQLLFLSLLAGVGMLLSWILLFPGVVELVVGGQPSQESSGDPHSDHP
jgi:hypothetical protein